MDGCKITGLELLKNLAMDGHTMRIMDGFIYLQIPRMESGHGHGIVDGYGQEKEFIHFSIRKILEIDIFPDEKKRRIILL